MRLVDYLDKGASLGPDAPCLTTDGTTRSYAEVRELSFRVSAALAARGVRPGDRVAVLSANDPTAFTCVFGISRAGAVWCPINPRNEANENRELLALVGCTTLIFQERFAPLVAKIRGDLPDLTTLVCLDGPAEGALSWEEFLAPGGDEEVDRPALDDLAMIAGTGGTTGRPKGVELTGTNLETMTAITLMSYPFGDRPVYLALAPLTHAAGVLCFPIMALGGQVVVMRAPDIGAFVALIERHRVTHTFLPPTLIYMALAHESLDDTDLSSLRCFWYGAAPMSAARLEEALRRIGPMAQLFGQTEAPMMISTLAPRDHFRADGTIATERLSSAGRPTPLVMVSIMDGGGSLLPRGAVGEIVVRGSLVMRGYHRDPEATAAASAHGWHHTGDVGYLDADNLLFIVDRAKDMVITGGFNVYSTEVEQTIMQHPAVQDCAVIGLPDEKWGERLTAVVQPRAGATVEPAELTSFVKERIGSVKTPKQIEVWPDLPRSKVGKVLKNELKATLRFVPLTGRIHNRRYPSYPAAARHPHSPHVRSTAVRPSPVLTGLVALTLGAAVAVAGSPPAVGAPNLAAPTVLAAPDIPLANQKAHVQQFQAIATANGGNRRSTTAGYTASVTYVFDRLAAAGYTVVRQNCTSGCTAGAGPNVIADWPGGDPANVYMFGAHLDSVAAGPGANDNGSGSATVLELALTLARTNPQLRNHVRFAFWTDEEQGLNGSEFYANTLPAAERARIKGYFNFDMVGSVNGGYFINRITSAVGQTLKAYYDAIGVATEENTEGAGRSDDAPFNAIGVQTSGVAAGASRVKTAAQVAKWGGSQSAFDPCYHRSCDTYPANVSDTVLDRAGDAAAYALWTLATGAPATTVWSDTFETATGWTTNPAGTDTATVGAWERGDPAATTSSGAKQLGTTVSGVNDLVTGRLAGSSAGVYDVDGGTTSIRSPAVTLPATGTLGLTLSWYLAHGSNSSSADFLRVAVVHSGGTTTLFTQAGAASDRDGAWSSGTWNLSPYAGQTVRILISAADASTASLVEAGVDDVRITQS